MIYITGDTHSDFTRFNTKSFPEQKEMTKDDYVIICGDFGGVWDYEGESKNEKYWLDWLENKSFSTLFIDGNHENFDRLYSYPIEKWHNGNVHKIRNSVIHLMRGQIFDVDGKTLFTFGGAKSHDISGGILEIDDPDINEKKRELNDEFIPYRINHLSWWERELPTEDEMTEGLKNLENHNNKIDFIITHCSSSSTQALMSFGSYKPDILTDYLENIKRNTIYKKWFFGHYHNNKNINAEEILLYEQIIRIS